MLLLIIFGSILLFGFAGLILEKVFCNKRDKWDRKADDYYYNTEQKDKIYKKYRTKYRKYYDASEVCQGIKFIGLIVGVVLLFFYSMIMLTFRIPIDRDYNDVTYEKQVLEYRLDNLDTLGVQTGNELLYNDIIKFNKKLRHAKRYVDNPWIGWFVNEKIATLDYIEIEGLGE